MEVYIISRYIHTSRRNLCFYMDASDSLNLKYQRCSVGVAWGDYDNDGWLDLYLANQKA